MLTPDCQHILYVIGVHTIGTRILPMGPSVTGLMHAMIADQQDFSLKNPGERFYISVCLF